MPGHKTHDKIGVVTAPVIAATSIYLQKPIEFTIALVTGFILATYFFSPDLDLNSRIYRRWGFLRIIWYPYRKMIHHRSWLSHSGPISATIRLLYLGLFLLPLVYYLKSRGTDLLTFQPWCAIIWLSVSLSDTVHLVADKIWRD